MATSQEAKLKELQQAFITADEDGDQLLNAVEFKKFVEIGYRKPCPDGMYPSLCKHFHRDPQQGLDWTIAKEVWLKAQGQPNRGKSPAPPQPQQSHSQSPSPQLGNSPQKAASKPANGTPDKMTAIKEAFIKCDKDANGLLNKSEFIEFMKVGFKRPSVPNAMYEQVCTHFKKDVDEGLDWSTVIELWKKGNAQSQSQSQAQKQQQNTMMAPTRSFPMSTPRQIRTADDSSNTHTKPGVPGLSGLSKPVPLSPAKSTGHLLRKARRKNESISGSGGQSTLTESNLDMLNQTDKFGARPARGDDEVSVESDGRSIRSTNRRLRRMTTDSNLRSGSVDDGQDASEMVVQMLEQKVKTLQKTLKIERAKRTKTEEMAQALLTQNDDFKKQTAELQQGNTKFRNDSKGIKEQLRKLKQQVDDDRQSIKHLQQQRATMKTERDEAFQLLTKIEKEHSMMVKKEKAKHKAELEKLSAGFLQSLGADPDKDVMSVIKELRQNNHDLGHKVDTLAATLERKNASLLEALQAVDTIAMEDEKLGADYSQQNGHGAHAAASSTQHKRTASGKMRDRIKSFGHRRTLSFKRNRNNNNSNSNSHNNSDDKDKENQDENGATGLPKPPKRRNSQVGLYDNSTGFWKRAVGDEQKEELSISNAKNGKELQFVGQKLTQDVSNKTESIQNLEMANTALMSQMAKMQKQMNAMKHQNNESGQSVSDLP